MRREILIVAILFATVLSDSLGNVTEGGTIRNFSTVHLDNGSDTENTEGVVFDDEDGTSSAIPTSEDPSDYYDDYVTTTGEITTTETTVNSEYTTKSDEVTDVELEEVRNEKEITTARQFPVTTTTTTSVSTTNKTVTKVTKATIPPPCSNCTTMQTTTDSGGKSDNKKASFNLDYLYFLLLVIPVVALFIGICWYCKNKRKRDGYIEPRAQKTKRFSTPSWVFSEPDFQDEEVTTLEEEKKQ